MNPDALKQALLQLGQSPNDQPSAQLQLLSLLSPLPQDNIFTKAINQLNESFVPSQSAQTIQPSPTPDIPTRIAQTFSDNPQVAHAVAMQESSLNPQARNHIPDQNIDAIGLMQINLPAHLKEVPGDTYEEKVKNLMDPDINLQVAKKIYDTQGWQPWQAYTSGAYKKYLP